MVQIVDYKSTQHAPRSLVLEAGEGMVKLTFPPTPKWLRVTLLVLAAAIPTSMGAMLGMVAWRAWQMNRQFGLPLPPIGRYLIEWVVVWLIFLAIAVYLFADEQRSGHLAESLALSKGRLVWSRRGLWGMRDRSVDASDITAIDLVWVPDIFCRGNAFTLVFRLRSGRLFTSRMNTQDPELPQRVVAAFRRELKLPPDPTQ
ncbi:MAG TPA: hypothetical protein VH518_15945 [Tepidisphaeraceae bacterium]|jgi:hypothetical protein